MGCLANTGPTPMHMKLLVMVGTTLSEKHPCTVNSKIVSIGIHIMRNIYSNGYRVIDAEGIDLVSHEHVQPCGIMRVYGQ